MGSEKIMTTAKNNMCCCRMMCDCMAFISYALNTWFVRYIVLFII